MAEEIKRKPFQDDEAGFEDDAAKKRPSEAEERKRREKELEEGLEESFPASDPPAATQPKKPTPAAGKK